jgi:hypothetical protein
MKPSALAAGVTAAISISLAGCIVVPPRARVVAPAVVVAPPEVVVPAGVVYVAPAYAVPAPGYVWAHHPRYGWGYRHARHGWHRGWY